MATIRDVAALAGVSISTVSRTLSGNIPVDPETQERVLEAVKALQYKPNALAKGLKEGKTNLIALVIPNITNPLFPAIARGVEDKARSLGYNVILCNTDENKSIEKNYIKEMNKRWIDGFIFATACDDSDHLLELRRTGTPVVLLVRAMEADIDKVVLDNFRGAYTMTQYLLQQGNRSIAIINGDLKLRLYRDRFNGYCAALRDAGIEINKTLICNEDSMDTSSPYKLMENMLNKGIRPDAVFATSDPKALGVIRAIHDAGLRIPEDVSVVGFDNLDISAMFEPPLTTMSQPLYKMGGLAVARLIDLIKNKDGDLPPKTFTVNSKLVIRQSSEKRDKK